MIKIGDLVEWELRGRKKWLAIVIGESFNSLGTPISLVHWVTGRYAGQEDYIHSKDLETIA